MKENILLDRNHFPHYLCDLDFYRKKQSPDPPHRPLTRGDNYLYLKGQHDYFKNATNNEVSS